MSKLLPNHSYSSIIYKHKKLPIYKTSEFDFYRCVQWHDDFYNKSVLQLQNGNLRQSSSCNRYSSLFKYSKTSYWSDSEESALSEAKKHGMGENLLIFHAYDDSSSTFPILSQQRVPLVLIDGRDTDFHLIIEKYENGIELNQEEKEFIEKIEQEKPDCFVFQSKSCKKGINFLFFENGFKKLAVKNVKLQTTNDIRQHIIIDCATTSDYSPIIENYWSCFQNNGQIKENENCKQYKEFLFFEDNYNYWLKKIARAYHD